MVERLIPVRIGNIELLVETVPVAGTELTSSRAQDAIERVSEVFSRAEEAVVEVARSTAEMIEKIADRGSRPDRVEIEFGLKFSATGSIIVAGVAGEATLRVLLAYDAKRPASLATGPQHDAPGPVGVQ